MSSPASIQYFKDWYLKKGLSRSNRYEVVFSVDTNSDPDILMPAESVTLPTKQFETIEEQWFGPARTIPVGVKFDSSVVITFPVSDDQTERTFFEEWMDLVVDPTTNENNYHAEVYKRNHMSINTLDMQNKVSSTYTFDEVYPSQIMPTQLSMPSMNDYTRMTVQFEYRLYTYMAGSGGVSNIP